MDKLKGLAKSRRFWASAVGLVAVVASDAFGIELNQDQLLGVVTVSQWESLYSSCEKLCLTSACKKLDEVFPLLIDKDEDCLDKEDEIEILDD